MGRRSRYSPEVKERAVRMVFEHGREYSSQWGAVTSIAAKIGCSAETLRKWVRQAERDQGRRAGLTTDERQPCSMSSRKFPSKSAFALTDLPPFLNRKS